jgi:hypothetical protein
MVAKATTVPRERSHARAQVAEPGAPLWHRHATWAPEGHPELPEAPLPDEMSDNAKSIARFDACERRNRTRSSATRALT